MKKISKPQLKPLIREAERLGASGSSIILSQEILVKEELAAFCNGKHPCPDYGRGASCPPHVAGPVEFRKWQAQSTYSMVVKIELPESVMFSHGRTDVMKLLHEIVAAVELKAVETGFENSKAFAGGSCKKLFCPDHDFCCVVAEKKTCRHSTSARPSLSGFGVDVGQLMISSGWSAQKAIKSDASDQGATSWVAGLILIA